MSCCLGLCVTRGGIQRADPGAVLGCNSAAAWALPCQSTMAQFSSIALKSNSDLVPAWGWPHLCWLSW